MIGRPSLRVFFFGDSICFGQGVSPHLIWVNRLSQALEQRFSDRVDLTVQNPSVNGNTTRQALERMAYDVQSHTPQVLLIQFGMNDCNGWETDKGRPRVSRATFRANLVEMIERGRTFGAKQIILGTNHPTTRTVTPLPHVDFVYDVANRDYNQITREVAADQGTLLTDAEAEFDAVVKAGTASYAELVLADQLHLSAAGHDIYFKARLPMMEHVVEKLLPELA